MIFNILYTKTTSNMSEGKCYCYEESSHIDRKDVECFHNDVEVFINACYNELDENGGKLDIFVNPTDFGIPGWDPVGENRKMVRRLYSGVESMKCIFAQPFVGENDYQEVIHLSEEFTERLDDIKKEVEQELNDDQE